MEDKEGYSEDEIEKTLGVILEAHNKKNWYKVATAIKTLKEQIDTKSLNLAMVKIAENYGPAKNLFLNGLNEAFARYSASQEAQTEYYCAIKRISI